MFMTVDRGKSFREISSLAIICTVLRGEEDKLKLSNKAKELESVGARVRICDFKVFNISSTQIREMLINKVDCPFINKKIKEYIKTYGLYGRKYE
jgi:nicotinic acid mononucleotide adenylyltransferase